MGSTVFAGLPKGSENVRTHASEEGDCGEVIAAHGSGGEEGKGEEFLGDSGDRVNLIWDIKQREGSACTLFPPSSFWLEQNSSYCLLPAPSFPVLLLCSSYTLIKVIHATWFKKNQGVWKDIRRNNHALLPSSPPPVLQLFELLKWYLL